ncbi:MAG: cupin domain-containing protein [Bacteroidota bacterium]
MTERKIYNPVQKDYVTFIKTSRETNGEYTLVDVELAVGGGVGLHFHKTYTEKFTVTEGVLGITLGKEDIRLKPGEHATAEKNVLHRFYNPESKPVKFQVQLQPASEGFERSLQVAYGLARDGKTNAKGIPLNIFHVALLLEMSESKLPGAYSIFEFLLITMARMARAFRWDKKLHRYYLSH